MNQLIRRIAFAAACLSITSQSTFAAPTAPAEQTSATIQRTATSGSSASVRLSKNLFKTEEYQAPYTVQVPYQVTEEYTVQVPYTVEVPYTDYETDYKDEYRCENVTRYRDEYRCENRTSYRQECSQEEECHLVPGGGGGNCRQVEECGTNAQGQPMCKTRTVCDGPSEPQRQCNYHNVCRNVPYTDRDCRNERVPYTDQECRTERVAYQRPVTRYRTETKYRNETRTRTVTKYRTEERCCETKTREVFDKQLQFQVNVSFPQDAVLVGSEVENLTVSLVGTSPASVSINSNNTIYGYKIANQSASGEVINVELALVPKFDLSNAGESSIKNMKIQFSNQLGKFTVTLEDTISNSRVQTVSSVEISDLLTGSVIEEQPVSVLVNGKKGIIVNAALDAQSKLKATLKVQRTGILVAGGALSFQKVLTYEKKAVQAEDVAALSDAALVQLTVGSQAGMSASMILADSSEEFADVVTNYSVAIYDLLADGTRKTLATVSLSRDQVKAVNNELKLADLLGAKASAALKAGKQLRLHIEAVRTADSAVIKAPIKFTVKASIKIK